MMRLKPLLIILFLVIFSCRKSEAEKAAEDYCNCMHKNIPETSERIAKEICEYEIITNYYNYRLEKIIIPMEYTMNRKVSQAEIDSAYNFFMEYDDYKRKKCKEFQLLY